MSRTVVATTTYYRDEDTTRFNLACRLIHNVVDTSELSACVVVDGSPGPQPRRRFSELGAHVVPQTEAGMAASRRQVFRVAHDIMAARTPIDHEFDKKITVWTEPEKHDIVRHIPHIIAPLHEGRAQIVIAGRTEASWGTYPRFQVESEKTANAVYRHVTGIDADVMFGQAAFIQEAAPLFMYCDPRLYGVDTGYIQHVAPLVAAACGYKIECVNVDFEYPPEQREEEETAQSTAMIAKRLSQMRSLIEAYITLANVLRLPRQR